MLSKNSLAALRGFLALCAVSCVLSAGAQPAVPAATTLAAPQPLHPMDFHAIPDYDEATLSPDGRFLAVLVPVQGFVNLGVIDLETRKLASRIGIPGAHIRSVQWVGNDRLIFSMARYGEVGARWGRAGGLYLVSRDGKEQRQLFQTAAEWFATGGRRFVYFEPLRVVPDSDEIIVQTNETGRESVDLFRLNVVTGRRTTLTAQRPPDVIHWVLDRDLLPRAAVSSVPNSTERIVHFRDSAQAPWRELWRNRPLDGSAALPLHFDADNKHLVIASNEGRDTMALFRYDPATRQRGELLEGHERFDIGADALGNPIGGLLLDAAGRDIVGFRTEAEKPLYRWTEPRREKLQELIDRALPDTRNVLQPAQAGSRSLVLSYSDRAPRRWYLLDEDSGRLQALFADRPWLDKRVLAEMKPVAYRSRDGVEMPAYLLEPPGHVRSTPLPMVVLVHGGPWDRGDTWGERGQDVAEAQLLASRGYAVLLPSFRGTTGLGRAILAGGKGQFGRRMQDDIEDATDWAVREGVADPLRICLSGASYGGYAALMGLAKTPEKYRCAIAGMPVTDLGLLISSGWSDISEHEQSRQFWVEMAGDPDKAAAALREVSPAHQAARIRGQVMLYGGNEDRRTPVEQMEVMRKALREQGKEPVWMLLTGEGHGVRGTRGRLELYARKFQFLRANLSPANAGAEGTAPSDAAAQAQAAP